MIKIGKTSSKVKQRYHNKTYNTYRFNLRKEDPLCGKLEELKKEQKLSDTIKKLLEKNL